MKESKEILSLGAMHNVNAYSKISVTTIESTTCICGQRVTVDIHVDH